MRIGSQAPLNWSFVAARPACIGVLALLRNPRALFIEQEAENKALAEFSIYCKFLSIIWLRWESKANENLEVKILD